MTRTTCHPSHVNITEAPVQGGVGNPRGLTECPACPGSAPCRLVRKVREAESRWPSVAGSEAVERGRTSSEGAVACQSVADLPPPRPLSSLAAFRPLSCASPQGDNDQD
jgi:hypothetical protein